MTKTYRVAPIDLNQIDRVFPLVEPVAPSLDLQTWRVLCRKVVSRSDTDAATDKIIVATNPLGYVQGLCVASIRESPSDGRVLDVPIFAVASAADEAGVVGDLLQYLRDRGQSEECGSIRIWTLGKDNWARHIEDAGLKRWDHGLRILLESGKRLTN
jgi:hypothetical protein